MEITPQTLVSLVAPLLTAVTIYASRWLWHKFESKLDIIGGSMTDRLQRIEEQTLKTNGRVTVLEADNITERERIAKLEGAVFHSVALHAQE